MQSESNGLENWKQNENRRDKYDKPKRDKHLIFQIKGNEEKVRKRAKICKVMDEKGDIITSRNRINSKNIREYYMQLYGNKFKNLEKMGRINNAVKQRRIRKLE